ncbi:MAG: hypothetical protein IID33_09295 [Planctomycetes bacterium]|nr:hypothetical protein [Planctomycetota bacterium]
MNSKSIHRHSPRRRGTVIVLVAVSLTVTLGFAALTIDLGTLYSARGQLQRAADASALAGASSFFSDAGLMQNTESLFPMIHDRSQDYSLRNTTLGLGTILASGDITIATRLLDTWNAPLDTSGLQRYNAVKVTVLKSGESPNGAVGFTFGRILGFTSGNVAATATAVLDDRFSEYDVQPGIMTPFTVAREIYEDMVVNGDDNYSHEGGVNRNPDGVPEVVLFPWKENGNGQGPGGGSGAEGAGNFGALNIGISNQGTAEFEQQILTGVTPDQLVSEVGTSDLTFYDSNGAGASYEINGNTGLSVGMEDSIEHRIGDVIGHFIHETVTLQGQSATFEVVGIRFGRIMGVDLHGSPNNKQLVIQPMAYTGQGIHVSPEAPSTNGLVGIALLVQ